MTYLIFIYGDEVLEKKIYGDAALSITHEYKYPLNFDFMINLILLIKQMLDYEESCNFFFEYIYQVKIKI